MGSKGGKGQAQAKNPPPQEEQSRKPKMTKDEDSIRGGMIFSMHRKESVHSGVFCSECGEQIAVTEEECNVSIKIGKRVCARHANV